MTTKPSKSSTQGGADEGRLIEIFRAGRHVDMHGREIEFTAADVEAIASGYSADLSEAPLVVGHPKTNGPAYGWVSQLVAKDGVLLAEPHQVDADFADLYSAGRFKKRSASFFLPDDKSNPTPGKFYLRHVGFLGAAAPAVKGLKDPVELAGDESAYVEFAFSDRRWGFAYAADMMRRLRDYLIDKEGLEKADLVLPDWQINSLKGAADADNDGMTAYADPDAPPTKRDPSPAADAVSAAGAAAGASKTTKETDVSQATADLAAREEALSKREQNIAAEEARINERRETERRNEAVAFADGLVGTGQLLPKDKATVVELLLALPTDAPLSFADGDDQVEKPAAELLRSLLSAAPKHIDFSEKAGGDQTVDLSDPQQVAKLALEFQASEADAGRTVSVVAAVQHVTKGSTR